VPITQLEISSTALRRDLADGRDPRYLVPDAIREQLLAADVYR
jgi:nicotinic acid mononucleotide adenylyltransferase